MKPSRLSFMFVLALKGRRARDLIAPFEEYGVFVIVCVLVCACACVCVCVPRWVYGS